jgi:hypothetical protein
MDSVDCTVQFDLNLSPQHCHPANQYILQVVARSCALDGGCPRFDDHVARARHTNGVSLCSMDEARVRLVCNDVTGINVRVLDKRALGFQYRGYVDADLTPSEVRALQAGETVVLRAPCRDNQSSAERPTKDLPVIGEATITLRPVRASGPTDRVPRSSRRQMISDEVYDEYKRSAMDVGARVSTKIDAIYAYGQGMRTCVEGGDKFMCPQYMEVPIGVRDLWQQREESCTADAKTLDNLVNVGRVIGKCSDVRELCRRDPGAVVRRVVAPACRAVANSLVYEDDINSEDVLTDRYTNAVGVARSCFMANERKTILVGDCEDSANLAKKMFYALYHAGPDASPDVKAIQKVLRREYACVTVALMANSGRLSAASATTVHNRRAFWSASNTQTVAEVAGREGWGTNSYCHTVAMIVKTSALEAMIADSSESGSLEPFCLLEGTSWCTSEKMPTTFAQRVQMERKLTDAVNAASRGGVTEVTCSSGPEDSDFYQSASHLSAPNGQAYYVVSKDGTRAPHFLQLLDDPGALKLVPMAPVLDEEEAQYLAVKLTKQAPDFPIRSSETARPEWATKADIEAQIESRTEVHGVLKGDVLPNERDALGPGVRVLCMPLFDGLDVRLCCT